MDPDADSRRRPLGRTARVLLAAILLLPLLVVPGATVFPFVFPRVVAFRVLSWALLAAVLSGCVLARRGRLRATPVTVLLGLAVAFEVVSGLAGTDPGRSWWDTPERMMGIHTSLARFAFYLGAVLLVRRPGEWDRWLLLAGAVGIPVAGIALLERLGIAVVPGGAGARAVSTLGHPAYLGAFGLFMVFAPGLLRSPSRRRGGRWLPPAIVVAGLVSILSGEARGAFVGLAAGLAVALVSGWLVSPRGSRARRFALRGGAVLLLGVTGVGGLALAGADLPLVRRLPSLLSRGAGVDTRIAAWEVSLDAARERPLLGYGPNNFFHAFNRHYPPRQLRYGYSETWFDDAHNEVLNTLAEQGFAGLALHLALLGTVFLAIWRGAFRGRVSPRFACVASGFLAGTFCSRLFLFADLSSSVHLAFFLALVDRRTDRAEPPETAPARPAGPRRVAAALPLLVAVALVAAVEAPALRAGVLARRALAQVGRGESSPVETMRSALDASPPLGPGLLELWSVTVLRVAAAGPEDPSSLPAAARFAWERLGARGRDVRAALLRAALLRRFPGLRGDPAALAETIRHLESVRPLSPRRQEVLFARAELALLAGDEAGALRRGRRAVRLDPKAGPAWYRYAHLLRAAGREEEARRILRGAKRSGARFPPSHREPVEAFLR